jgi:hypothetical protein
LKSELPVLCLIASCAFAPLAHGQEFPEGSAALSPESLSSAISGKVFSVKTAQGSTWRWQFKTDGYFFINIGSFSDSGKWATKDSALCTEGRQIKYSCNEVRTAGQELLLKRDNGEIVKLVPQ